MNQIALYDKAWDSIMKLPKRVQKQIPEFLEKFRTNSRDPSLHLEPISTFADPQLRTARVNRKYRAIVHAPQSGKLFHLLYVDNHDEAMAWAEHKVFEWNDFTHSYQVFTRPDNVPDPLVLPTTSTPAAPPATADGFAEQTDEQLLAIGVPGVLLPSVREIMTLDELEQLYDYLPIEALENLSMLLEGSSYDTIVREVAEGRSQESDRDRQEQSANNQRSFFELTDDDLLNQMLSGEVAKWRLFLHPSQRRLVEGQFKGPTKVTGGAGTGKTVAALHRARVLAGRGAANTQQPILFTTYTRSLSSNLEDELRRLGVDERLVVLDNIDHFVVNAAQQVGLVTAQQKILDFPGSKRSIELWREVLDFRLADYSPDFLHAEYQDVILHQGITDAATYYRASRRGRRVRISRKDKMAIWELVEEYTRVRKAQGYVDLYAVYNRLAQHYTTAEVKPFRHVIADELQDFSNVHLRLLRSLVAEQADDLFLVGDPLQQIYDRRIVFNEAGVNVRGRRSRRLKINYRTTEQIKQAAVRVIEGVDFSDFDEGREEKSGYVSLRGGAQPTYATFTSSEVEAAALINQLNAYLYPPDGQPGVSAGEVCIATRTRAGAKPFRTALHQAGIPFYDLTDRTAASGDRSGVMISTFHNLKGLEFKIVFLADVSAATFPYQPYDFASLNEEEQEAHTNREKSLLYVAISRAVTMVHLSGVGQAIKELG